MNKPSQETSLHRVPSDLAVLFGTDLVLLTIGLTGALVAGGVASARRAGDFSLFWFAVAMGGVGTVTLFHARLPLYRQRRFTSFGPAALDLRHRRLYWRAYVLIGASVALLGLLLAAVR
jgi:hypothetical protein